MRNLWLLLSLKLLICVHWRLAWAIQGNYITTDFLKDKKLENPLNVFSEISLQDCEDVCIENAWCDRYSYDQYAFNCEIYNSKDSGEFMQQFGARIFVKEKGLEDDYYRIAGPRYLKPVFNSTTYWDAKEFCNSMNGGIVKIKSVEMNKYIDKLRDIHHIWTFWISLTDEDKEDRWVHDDGSHPSYINFREGGVWTHRKKNCAIFKVGGKWEHENCKNFHYFICDVPIY